MRINIKPLSVNEAYNGRRTRSEKYNSYKMAVSLMLPKLDIPEGIKLDLSIHVGFSSKGSDLDNVCKPFQDILSKVYGFNDNAIYKLTMTKEIVNKGDEFIEFDLKQL